MWETISKYLFLIGPRDPHTDWSLVLIWMWTIGCGFYQRLFQRGEAGWNVLGSYGLLLVCVSKLDSFANFSGPGWWIWKGFFETCRLLFELSDEGCSVLMDQWFGRNLVLKAQWSWVGFLVMLSRFLSNWGEYFGWGCDQFTTRENRLTEVSVASRIIQIGLDLGMEWLLTKSLKLNKV